MCSKLVAAFLAVLMSLLCAQVQAQLGVGEACGYNCGNCSPLDQVCQPGLSCVYNPSGCARGYHGVCLPTCSKPGRDATECASVGDHCTFYPRVSPNCGVLGEFGCRLDINKYLYNSEVTCSALPCEISCARFPNACIWDAVQNKCVGRRQIRQEVTPKCWSSCKSFPPGNAMDTCPECTLGLAEYEYETPANSYCWRFLDNPKVDRGCNNRYTSRNMQ